MEASIRRALVEIERGCADLSKHTAAQAPVSSQLQLLEVLKVIASLLTGADEQCRSVTSRLCVHFQLADNLLTILSRSTASVDSPDAAIAMGEVSVRILTQLLSCASSSQLLPRARVSEVLSPASLKRLVPVVCHAVHRHESSSVRTACANALLLLVEDVDDGASLFLQTCTDLSEFSSLAVEDQDPAVRAACCRVLLSLVATNTVSRAGTQDVELPHFLPPSAAAAMLVAWSADVSEEVRRVAASALQVALLEGEKEMRRPPWLVSRLAESPDLVQVFLETATRYLTGGPGHQRDVPGAVSIWLLACKEAHHWGFEGFFTEAHRLACIDQLLRGAARDSTSSSQCAKCARFVLQLAPSDHVAAAASSLRTLIEITVRQTHVSETLVEVALCTAIALARSDSARSAAVRVLSQSPDLMHAWTTATSAALRAAPASTIASVQLTISRSEDGQVSEGLEAAEVLRCLLTAVRSVESAVTDAAHQTRLGEKPLRPQSLQTPLRHPVLQAGTGNSGNWATSSLRTDHRRSRCENEANVSEPSPAISVRPKPATPRGSAVTAEVLLTREALLLTIELSQHYGQGGDRSHSANRLEDSLADLHTSRSSRSARHLLHASAPWPSFSSWELEHVQLPEDVFVFSIPFESLSFSAARDTAVRATRHATYIRRLLRVTPMSSSAGTSKGRRCFLHDMQKNVMPALIDALNSLTSRLTALEKCGSDTGVILCADPALCSGPPQLHPGNLFDVAAALDAAQPT